MTPPARVTPKPNGDTALILEKILNLSNNQSEFKLDLAEINTQVTCLAESFGSCRQSYITDHIPLVAGLRDAHRRIDDLSIIVNHAIEERTRMFSKMDEEIKFLADTWSKQITDQDKRLTIIADRQKISISILIFIGAGIGSWLLGNLLGLLN